MIGITTIMLEFYNERQREFELNSEYSMCTFIAKDYDGG